MARTAVEIQFDLDTINSAIQDLLTGKRISELRLGSGDFARLYRFQDITYDTLQEERSNLLNELAQTTNTTEIVFRKQSHVQLRVTKFRK